MADHVSLRGYASEYTGLFDTGVMSAGISVVADYIIRYITLDLITNRMKLLHVVILCFFASCIQ